MKTFGISGYLLRNARVEVRLVYTAFLALVSIGLITMAVFEAHHIGPTPGRVAAYYRGGERAGEMTFAKTFRELVEVTHFHSFIMGLVFLVLAHLFIATTIAPGPKITLIVLAVAGLTGDLIAPWLIRYVSGAFAYLQITSWLAEWIGFGAFVAVPISEMWFTNGRNEFPPE